METKTQEQLEQAAFLAGGGGFRASAQRVEDFLQKRPTVAFGNIAPSYLPGVTPADLDTVLPSWLTDNLRFGLRALGRQLSGFDHPDAVLTGPETRTSSPVRLLRTPQGISEQLPGLYPVGEGAGYAGGIVSAAADGIAAALHALEGT